MSDVTERPCKMPRPDYRNHDSVSNLNGGKCTRCVIHPRRPGKEAVVTTRRRQYPSTATGAVRLTQDDARKPLQEWDGGVRPTDPVHSTCLRV